MIFFRWLPTINIKKGKNKKNNKMLKSPKKQQNIIKCINKNDKNWKIIDKKYHFNKVIIVYPATMENIIFKS